MQDRPDVPDDVKEIYITSPELTPAEHVEMQAAFQPYVDSGISKTINMPHEATEQDVYDTYMLAWKTDCKGITVYRAGSREKEINYNFRILVCYDNEDDSTLKYIKTIL